MQSTQNKCLLTVWKTWSSSHTDGNTVSVMLVLGLELVVLVLEVLVVLEMMVADGDGGSGI